MAKGNFIKMLGEFEKKSIVAATDKQKAFTRKEFIAYQVYKKGVGEGRAWRLAPCLVCVDSVWDAHRHYFLVRLYA